ncbi:aKG-HExxH-type peptide beta-hydroxylase [Streptomyces antimicrobicus]|uniref:HEXXH motif domain-containing protein n=1 Tax=Streptomyces antimicrobicus TaxID=2883108 RepID=A0ABS8B9H0_9ACTN|nr:HEXXH motif-containing putative peptide modification protein [Streptomyces antimicrobicus]MCB5181260.1 HEXXH motif domain-containing protein [Streptomyces antimicrobicus]
MGSQEYGADDGTRSDGPATRLRMPGTWFDELASGGGSAEAVAFLVRAERTRRLMLLGELLDRLDELPDALGELGTAAAAWELFAEAAEAAPQACEDLLMSPQVGCWTAHLVRRLYGTAAGPPLWADAGHLFAVCLTARIRAGLDTDLQVPLRDGGLSLPTLGLARIGGLKGFGTARARLRGRDLRLTSGGRTVVVRPLDGAWRSHWTPARTFAGTRIWLDDLDPYRDLDEPVAPQPLAGAEAERWQRLFAEATAILARPAAGGPGRLRVAELRRVVPADLAEPGGGRGRGPTRGPAGALTSSSSSYGTPARTSASSPAAAVAPAAAPAAPSADVLVSATTSDAFGSMVVSRPPDALALAEAMVHEFQHSKLGALLHLFPLLHDDGAEVHYAPWRPDPRHTTGLLHGAYAFTGVTGFWRDRMADPSVDTEAAAFHFALRRLQTRLVVRTLLTRAELTAAGTRLLRGLAATLDAWLREPVPPRTAARARAAALSHQVEWRLRNVRCDDRERTALASAFRAGGAPPPPGAHRPVLAGDPGPWSDPRATLYLVPPRTAAGADARLAAGDPATARALYAETLRRSPADPHALSGWLLAEADLAPPHRHLLRRPERLLALAPATPEELREAAAWLAGT